MQHYIRTITASLLERLPEEQLYYTPSELQDAGFPGFLVNRIKLELERNLADSVVLPDSDWADMQTDSVQDAWENFLNAIHAETRIPQSFLKSVVENAVEDTLDLLAEPQRVVIDTLFRNEDSATLVDLQVRRAWITINGYLADAVIRYMSRRNITEIDKVRAGNIVRQIDTHLSAGYTPLKWAQALETWFQLFGETIPAPLVQRYFDDKGLRNTSRKFQDIEEGLSKSRLIEYFSIPDYDYDEYEAELTSESTEPDNIAVQTEPEVADSSDETDAALDSPKNSTETEEEIHPSANADSAETETDLLDPETAETTTKKDLADPADAIFGSDSNSVTTGKASGGSQDKESVEYDPFLDDTLSPDPINDDDDFIATLKATEITVDSVADEDSEVEEEVDEVDDSVNETTSAEEDNDLDKESTLSQEESDEEMPIWQKFLSEETDSEEESDDEILQNVNTSTIADLAASDLNDEENSATEDFDFDSEIPEQKKSTPAIEDALNFDLADSESQQKEDDLAATDEETEEISEAGDSAEKASDNDETDISSRYFNNDHEEEDVIYLTDEAKELFKYLESSKDAYIETLFRNDEASFYTQLNEISSFNDWQTAGRYIMRDIFARNRVDMYSDEAVNFTDLLQQYFEDNAK